MNIQEVKELAHVIMNADTAYDAEKILESKLHEVYQQGREDGVEEAIKITEGEKNKCCYAVENILSSLTKLV